jgi:hypothetical protein
VLGTGLAYIIANDIKMKRTELLKKTIMAIWDVESLDIKSNSQDAEILLMKVLKQLN